MKLSLFAILMTFSVSAFASLQSILADGSYKVDCQSLSVEKQDDRIVRRQFSTTGHETYTTHPDYILVEENSKLMEGESLFSSSSVSKFRTTDLGNNQFRQQVEMKSTDVVNGEVIQSNAAWTRIIEVDGSYEINLKIIRDGVETPGYGETLIEPLIAGQTYRTTSYVKAGYVREARQFEGQRSPRVEILHSHTVCQYTKLAAF